ncbi:initiation-specific alpha-1,6-mannosyltransferase [Xylariaceae sp. FL0255]|nr:initiation-specific alpha-1,6-mannosyltransferase [Xylariaceae sp. FL0255]
MSRQRQIILGGSFTGFVICYLLYHLYFARDPSNSSSDFRSPLTTESESSSGHFPMKIWQSWKDDSDDPTPRTTGFPRKWREMNPTWQYERITDANSNAFVANRCSPYISEVFINLHDPIMRADLLRYLVLLLEGGVWADIDVLPHQPISSWIPESYQNIRNLNMVIGIENDKHKRPIWPGSQFSVQLAQYTILTKPNHPAMRRVVDRIIGNLIQLLETKAEGITFEDVMSTTGPFAFTEAVMEYWTEVTGTTQTGEELDRLQEPKLVGDILVLPKDSFGWLPHDHDNDRGHPSILVEHLFIGSWRASHPG